MGYFLASQLGSCRVGGFGSMLLLVIQVCLCVQVLSCSVDRFISGGGGHTSFLPNNQYSKTWDIAGHLR